MLYNPSTPDPFVELRDRDLPCGNCDDPLGSHEENGCIEVFCECKEWIPEEEAPNDDETRA